MSEPDDVALLRAEAWRGPQSMRDGVRNSLHELLDTAALPSLRKVLNAKGPALKRDRRGGANPCRKTLACLTNGHSRRSFW
jgi:hypothetical protein